MKKDITENDVKIVSGMDADGNFGFYTKDDRRVPALAHAWGLTDDEHMELIEGQGNGKLIKWLEKNNWMPTLEDPDPPTQVELAAAKRRERDAKLAATDKYMMLDYPIGEAERELVKEYRQWLRDLPALPEFPNIEIPTIEEYLEKNKKN